MYLLNSGGDTLFVVPGVAPRQLVLPSNTIDSKILKTGEKMEGKMQPPSGVGGRKTKSDLRSQLSVT